MEKKPMLILATEDSFGGKEKDKSCQNVFLYAVVRRLMLWDDTYNYVHELNKDYI